MSQTVRQGDAGDAFPPFGRRNIPSAFVFRANSGKSPNFVPPPSLTAHLLFERTTGSLGARALSFAPERQRHKRLFGWVLILFGKLQTPLRSNRSNRSRHGNTATPQKRSPPPGDPIGSNCGSIAGERARARARTHTRRAKGRREF